MMGDQPGAVGALRRVAHMREVAHLLQVGVQEDALPGLLGVSEAEAARMARQVRQGYLDAPDTAVREVLLLREAGAIGAAVMLDRLASLPLTVGQHGPGPLDGRKGGTWDLVHEAAGRGVVSRDEYEALAARVLGSTGRIDVESAFAPIDDVMEALTDALAKGTPGGRAAAGVGEEPAVSPYRPYSTTLTALRALAAESGRSEASITEWLIGPSRYFGGQCPAAVIGSDPEAVIQGARDLWGQKW